MSTTIVLYVAAALVGVGLAVAVAALVPRSPDLAGALRNLHPDDLLVRPSSQDGPIREGWRDALGHRVHARAAHLPFLSVPEADLRVLGLSASEHYATKTIWSVVGLMATSAVTTLLGIGLALPFFVGLLVAAAAWFVPDMRVRERAQAYREDFAYAAVSYLRLVAINRQAGIGIVAAMEQAARTSDAWMWVRIREELTLARWRGITPWDGLAQLSDQIEVPELREVSDIVRLTESGANVTDNLMARAASLRDRLLTKEATAANEATQSLAIPLGGLGAVFLFALLLPAVLRLSGV